MVGVRGANPRDCSWPWGIALRVLQLTQRFPPALGGVEDHVLRLAKGLHAAGVDVEIATSDLLQDVPLVRLDASSDSYPFRVTRYRGIKIADVPHGLGIISPGMLLGTLSREAEVFHAHAYGYFPTWVAALARRLEGPAFVITPHSDAGRPSWSKRVYDQVVPRMTLRAASRVIALTHREAIHLESLGVRRERIAVIPNGVDLKEFKHLPTAHPSSPHVTALFVGRLDPDQKGLESLLRALAVVPPETDLHLRLVGADWGGGARVRSWASRFGVQDRITLVGAVTRDRLLDEYARADLLVLPSLFEPFGIVLLEAMAAGLPVVASNVGGIPEVVEEGATALLVPPGDPHGLAEALQRVASDDALRREMGRRGRTRVQAFSWAGLVPRIMRVYDEALAEAAA